MTTKTIIRARELREMGLTHEAIGKELGVSRQRIHQILGKQRNSMFRPIDEAKAFYPNMARWMNENQVSRAELARRAFGADAVAKSISKQNAISDILTGTYKNIPKPYIDALIKATGLPYEVLFATREQYNKVGDSSYESASLNWR